MSTESEITFLSMNIMVFIKVVSWNFFKQKSKTDRYYSTENNRFNIGICQSWAWVRFLLAYIIQFFSVILKIMFPSYDKGFFI